MGILNHKRIICSYIAMAMVFTQVVPTGWSEGPTLQQELEKTVFIQTLEAANAEKSETLKQSNNDTTSFFDQDGALTAVNDNKMPNEEDMLQGMPGDKTENDGKIDADQESVMLPEVMVGMFEKADGTIDAAVRDRLMKDIEKNHPHLVANIWIDGLLVSGFESDEQLEAFIVEMRNRKDVEYAERNRIQEIQLYDSLPFKFTPQAEVAFPDQIIIDGEKVKMDVEYFVDVLKIMMNKARRDSGFICDEGCGTAADLFLLKGINQVFSLKDLQKFDAFNEMPGVTMPNFTNEGWIDFTTELLSKYKKADLDIFEGMIIASKSMIMAGSKFSFGTTVTQSYISGYSEISLLKKPEVILRTISAEKVWALIKNGADVLENSKLPEDALLALATHLGVKTEDIVDLNVFYDNYQWFVDGNYPKNGVIQHFAGMIEDRFIPLEAAISIPRYVTEAPTMFEGNPSELIQFDEAIQQVYGLPMPKKPLLARFYVSVVDTDADINAEAALAISNELGMDLNSLNRISAESTYVCMAMNVCPTKAWNISVDAKDGFIYKGSLSYYPNRKEAYRVNITEVIPAINPSEKAILESLSKTFDLSFDDLKGLVKFQTLKDGSINVYFAKTKHTMGDERILNVLGSNALPSFANFKVLVTLCKPSPGFSCEGSTQVVSARMEWAEENGKMPNAVIDFVDQGRIDRVQWFVDEKTPMSRQVCGGDVCWMETVEGTLTHMGDIHVYHWGKDNALKIEVRSSLLYVRQEGPHTMDMKMDGNGEFVDQVGVQFYPLPVPRDLGLKGVITFHFDGQNHYIDKFLEYENGELVSTSIFQWLITPDRIAYCLPAPGYSCEHDVQKGEKKLTGIERLDANGKTISTISAANPAARYIQMPSLGQSGTAYVFITGDKEYSREVNYKNFEDLLAQVKQLEESISKLSPVEKAVIEKLSEVLDIPFDTLKDMVKTRVSQDKADFGTIYVSFISGDAMMGIDRTIDPTGENNLPSSVSFKIHTEQFCTTGMPANCGASYTFESMNINWNSVVDNVQLNKIAEVSFDLEGRVLRSFWTTTRQGIDNCTGPVCTTQAFPLISDFAFIDFYDYDKAGVVITRSNSQFYLWSQPSTMPVVDGKPYDPYPRSNPNQTIQMKVYMQKAMDNQGYFVNKVEEFKDGVVIATSDFTYMTNVEFPKCAPGEICVQGGRETHKQLVSVTRTSLPANFKTQAEIRDGNIAVISIRDYQEKIQFNSLDGLLKAMARIEEEHGQSEIPAREAILNSLTQTFGYSLKEAEELLKNARIEEGLVDENGKPMISLGGTFRIILSPKNGTGSLSNVLFPLDEAGHPKSIVYTIVRNELPAAPCAVNADGTLMGNCPMGGVNDTIQKATISFENHRSEVKFSNNQAVSAVNSMRDPFAVCIQSPCDVFVKLNQMNFNYDANGQLSGVAIYHNNENTSVGKFVNPSKSYVDFVKYGSRFYVNKVSDSYAGDERISEFQYLIAMADIMCVQGSICESPEPFVSLNQISRHRLIPGTSDKIEELSTIYDGVITFLKKKEKTKGSFREQLNQAKVFEDSILKQGGVFQKMQNVLAEIQGIADQYYALERELSPLRAEFSNLNDILRGSKTQSFYNTIMIELGFEGALRDLKSWIEEFQVALDKGDQSKMDEIEKAFRTFIEKAPYELSENEGEREVYYSSGDSYREVLRELEGLINRTKKNINEMPSQIEDLKKKIEERNNAWLAQAQKELDAFVAMGVIQSAMHDKGDGNAYWMQDMHRQNDPWGNVYGATVDYLMWPTPELWIESEQFNVILANGDKLRIEVRNGKIDPKQLGLMNAISHLSEKANLKPNAIKVLRESFVHRHKGVYSGHVLGFKHFLSVGEGFDKNLFIIHSPIANSQKEINIEAKMNLRELTQEMMALSDVNADGVLGVEDIATILEAIHQTDNRFFAEDGDKRPAKTRGDVNQDGFVDVKDVVIVMSAVELSSITEAQLIQIAKSMIDSIHDIKLPNPLDESRLVEMIALEGKIKLDVHGILLQLKSDLGILDTLKQKISTDGDKQVIAISSFGSPAARELENYAAKLINDFHQSIMSSNMIIVNESGSQIELPIKNMIEILTAELKKANVGIWSMEESYHVLKGLNADIVGKFHPTGGHLYNVFQHMVFSLAYGPSSEDLLNIMIRFAKAHGSSILTDSKLDIEKFRDVLVFGKSKRLDARAQSFWHREFDTALEEIFNLGRKEIQAFVTQAELDKLVMICKGPGCARNWEVSFVVKGVEYLGSVSMSWDKKWTVNVEGVGYRSGDANDVDPTKHPTESEKIIFSKLELMKFSDVFVNDKNKTHEFSFETLASGVVKVTMMFSCEAPAGMACKPTPPKSFTIRLQEGIATFAPVEIDVMSEQTEFVVPAPGSFKLVNIPANAEISAMFEKADTRRYSLTGNLRELTGPSTLMRTAFEFMAIDENGQKQIFIIDGVLPKGIADKLRHAIEVNGGTNIAITFEKSMVLEGVQLYTALMIDNVSSKKYPSKYFNQKDFEIFRTTFGLKFGDNGYNDQYDFNDDGTVGISDFGFFRKHFRPENPSTRLIVNYAGGQAYIDWSATEKGKLVRTDIKTGEAMEFVEAYDAMSCSYPANGPAMCAGMAFPGEGFEQVGSYKKDLADGGYEERIIFGRPADYYQHFIHPTDAEKEIFSKLELMQFSDVFVNDKNKTHEFLFETLASGVVKVTMMFSCEAPEGAVCRPAPPKSFTIRLEEGIATFAPVEIDVMSEQTEFVVPAPGSFKLVNIPANAEISAIFEKADTRQYNLTGNLRELTGPSTLMRPVFEFTAIDENGQKQIFIIDGVLPEGITERLRHAIEVGGGKSVAITFEKSMILEGVQLHIALAIEDVSSKKYPSDYFNQKDYESFRATFGLKIGDKGYNDRYDFNGDGTVGISDFGFFRKHYKGDSESEQVIYQSLVELLSYVDKDNNGVFTAQEALAFTKEMKALLFSQEGDDRYNEFFDVNKDGVINGLDLNSHLKVINATGQSDLTRLSLLDTNKDQVVSEDEAIAALSRVFQDINSGVVNPATDFNKDGITDIQDLNYLRDVLEILGHESIVELSSYVDKDNNGVVTAQEALAFTKEMKALLSSQKGDDRYNELFDVNKDGFIDGLDLNFFLEFIKATGHSDLTRLSLLDTNKDEVVSADETIAALSRVFEDINSGVVNPATDFNKDGITDIQDLYFLKDVLEILGHELLVKLLNYVDKDNNGVFTAQEALAFTKEMKALLSSQKGDDRYNELFDVNKDGFIDGLDLNFFLEFIKATGHSDLTRLSLLDTNKDEVVSADETIAALSRVFEDINSGVVNPATDFNKDGITDIQDLYFLKDVLEILGRESIARAYEIMDSNSDGIVDDKDAALINVNVDLNADGKIDHLDHDLFQIMKNFTISGGSVEADNSDIEQEKTRQMEEQARHDAEAEQKRMEEEMNNNKDATTQKANWIHQSRIEGCTSNYDCGSAVASWTLVGNNGHLESGSITSHSSIGGNVFASPEYPETLPAGTYHYEANVTVPGLNGTPGFDFHYTASFTISGSGDFLETENNQNMNKEMLRQMEEQARRDAEAEQKRMEEERIQMEKINRQMEEEMARQNEEQSRRDAEAEQKRMEEEMLLQKEMEEESIRDQEQGDFDAWYESMKNNPNVVEMFNGDFPEGFDTLQAAKDLMKNAGWDSSWTVDCKTNLGSKETTCWILKGDKSEENNEEMNRQMEEEQRRMEEEARQMEAEQKRMEEEAHREQEEMNRQMEEEMLLQKEMEEESIRDQEQGDFDAWYESMKNNPNVVEMFNGDFPEGFDTLQAAKDLMKNAGWDSSWTVDCKTNLGSKETTCWILKGDKSEENNEEMNRQMEEEQKRKEEVARLAQEEMDRQLEAQKILDEERKKEAEEATRIAAEISAREAEQRRGIIVDRYSPFTPYLEKVGAAADMVSAVHNIAERPKKTVAPVSTIAKVFQPIRDFFKKFV